MSLRWPEEGDDWIEPRAPLHRTNQVQFSKYAAFGRSRRQISPELDARRRLWNSFIMVGCLTRDWAQ